MRAFWTFLTITILAATFAFWIIPAMLEWQKCKHEHKEKMADKAVELKKVSDSQNEKQKKGFTHRLTSFFEKTVAEVVPALAGKMIGGV